MAAEHREFARVLRKQPTKAEDILWRCLRGSRFRGAKFRLDEIYAAGSSRPVGDRLCRRQNSQATIAKLRAFHKTPFRNAMR